MRKCFAVLCMAGLLLAAAGLAACSEREGTREYAGENVTRVDVMGQMHAELFEPGGAVLLRSARECSSFQRRCASAGLSGDAGNPSFEEQIEGYGTLFFEKGELLVLCITHPYACYRSEVLSVEAEEDAVVVEVEVHTPGEGVDCAAVIGEDLLFIELPAGFCGEKEVRIERL